MGEAKRRRVKAPLVVYHHTSTLRTNLIWMSGVIQVEGKSEGVFHPRMGEIRTDAVRRRGMEDFPPLAWFTRRIEIPRTLVVARLQLVSKDSGEMVRDIQLDEAVANGIAMNRIAIGFPAADIPVVPWPEHFGYHTDEGRDLNETAREAGDDPDDWYVSEEPVDVLKAAEIWSSRSILKPKLRRLDGYLDDMRRMVRMCRENPRCYIAPSWMTEEQATALAQRLRMTISKPS